MLDTLYWFLKKYPTLPINYPMLNKRTKKNTKSPILPKKIPYDDDSLY